MIDTESRIPQHCINAEVGHDDVTVDIAPVSPPIDELPPPPAPDPEGKPAPVPEPGPGPIDELPPPPAPDPEGKAAKAKATRKYMLSMLLGAAMGAVGASILEVGCGQPGCPFCEGMKRRATGGELRMASEEELAGILGVPRVADDNEVMDAQRAAGQASEVHAHIARESAKEKVRTYVMIPMPSREWRATEALRGLLWEASHLFSEWADVDGYHLGQLTHAEPGLHGALMNAQQYIDQARQAIDRAAGKLPAWVAFFTDVVNYGTEVGAWEYVSAASRALDAGPHTQDWNVAVQWFGDVWSAPHVVPV